MERDDIFQEDPSGRGPLALDQGVLLDDKFRIGRVLGVGGFGITYLAFDEVLEMVVAVKEYLPNDIAVRKTGSDMVQPLSSSGEEEKGFEYGLERFLQEARTLAKFERHPNIVRVRTFFKENGTAYLVMNFYQGQTLAEYLEARNGFIPEEEALLIMDQVLNGLGAVHEEGVLHRDIDPNNVYLADDGTVVLLDFGAARSAVGEQTQSMSVVLKRGYAPHEQYHSYGDQGPWTDIYACSATFYRSLTGYKPPEAAARILNDELAAPNELVPSLSDATNVGILEGLSVRPDDRPQSVDEFADLLPDSDGGRDTEPGWVGDPTSMEAPSADTESAAELQVTATHACRLYVGGTLSTEIPSEETYTLAVEGGSHRLRAVRTDRASSGNATVTASEADPEVESGSQLSIEALMWQDVVTASEEESTTVEVDFEEEDAAEPPAASHRHGATEVPGPTEVPEETVAAGETVVPDETVEADAEEETPEEAKTDDAPDTTKPNTSVSEKGGAVGPATDESQMEEAGSRPEPLKGDEAGEDVATLRVRTDRPAQLLVDGDLRARLDAGDDQTVALSPGPHRVRAESTDGTTHWEQDITPEAGTKQTFHIPLDQPAAPDQGAMVSRTALQYIGAGTGVLVLLFIGWWVLSNEPPLATPDQALTTVEPIIVDVTTNDRDPDGRRSRLQIRSVGPVPDSVAQIETIDSTRLRIRPAAGFAGTAQIPYVLADAPGDTAQSYVTLRVPFNGAQRVVTRQVERPQDVEPVSLGEDASSVAIAALGDEAVGWVPHSRATTGHFDSFAVLATSQDGAVDVHAADLTGNGRSDLLSSSLRGDAVQWYENRADSAFAGPQPVTTAADGPVAVETADVDGDGDADVIVGALLSERLLWYENQGDGQFGEGRELAAGVRGLQALHVTNLDNDDTPDLLAASYRDSTVYRYEPIRPSSDSVHFRPRSSIAMDTGGPIEVQTADLTGNGWADVIVGLAGDSPVVVVENQTDTTGTLQFEEGRVLETAVETVEGIATGDIEGDGAPDVFAGSFDSDAVVWFENEGKGIFRSAQPVATNIPDVLSLAVTDVNGDGTPDVLVSSQAENVVAWYENHLR